MASSLQHTSMVIDIVFLPIYLALSAGAIFNLVKHGAGKAAGFLHLALFSFIRLAAFALLIYNYHHPQESINLVIAAFALQGLGYSFLLSSTIALLSRLDSLAHPTSSASTSSAKQATIPRFLYLINTVALVLLIIGYTHSQDVFQGKGGTLNTMAKVGDVLFCLLTIACFALALRLMPAASRAHREGRSIALRVLAALVLMAVREGYLTYRVLTQDPLTQTSSTVWLKLILQYVMEVLVVVIYLSLGFVVRSSKNMAAAAVQDVPFHHSYDYQQKPNYDASYGRA